MQLHQSYLYFSDLTVPISKAKEMQTDLLKVLGGSHDVFSWPNGLSIVYSRLLSGNTAHQHMFKSFEIDDVRLARRDWLRGQTCRYRRETEYVSKENVYV